VLSISILMLPLCFRKIKSYGSFFGVHIHAAFTVFLSCTWQTSPARAVWSLCLRMEWVFDCP
jgi:hypothetical protein